MLLVWLLLYGNANAHDLGEFGPTYKIREMDAFEWITQQRLPELLQSGLIDKMNTKLQTTAQHRVENPKGIRLPQAFKNSRKTQSLIYILPRDIKDAAGRILFKKGTTMNPADILPESDKTLLFIDGDNLAQVNFALNEVSINKFTKIVLVCGRPLELIRTTKVAMYFDQGQRLIQRFGIKALPAKVYRETSNLIIEEIVI